METYLHTIPTDIINLIVLQLNLKDFPSFRHLEISYNNSYLRCQRFPIFCTENSYAYENLLKLYESIDSSVDQEIFSKTGDLPRIPLFIDETTIEISKKLYRRGYPHIYDISSKIYPDTVYPGLYNITKLLTFTLDIYIDEFMLNQELKITPQLVKGFNYAFISHYDIFDYSISDIDYESSYFSLIVIIIIIKYKLPVSQLDPKILYYLKNRVPKVLPRDSLEYILYNCSF